MSAFSGFTTVFMISGGQEFPKGQKRMNVQRLVEEFLEKPGIGFETFIVLPYAQKSGFCLD